MTKSINHKFVFPLLNAIYFSTTTAALGWMMWTYFGPTWIMLPVLALGGFFFVAAAVAMMNVRTANRLLVGSSAFTLKRSTQRLIRLGVLAAPLPILAFGASFAFLSAISNSDWSIQSHFADARQNFIAFERQLFGKSALDPDRPTAAAQADVDFGPYMADLQRKIKHNWYPPKLNRTDRAVVQFKIHENGRMTDPKLIQSSGTESFDKACMDALQQQYRNLPAGASENVDIQFTFDYNVFGKNHDNGTDVGTAPYTSGDVFSATTGDVGTGVTPGTLPAGNTPEGTTSASLPVDVFSSGAAQGNIQESDGHIVFDQK